MSSLWYLIIWCIYTDGIRVPQRNQVRLNASKCPAVTFQYESKIWDEFSRVCPQTGHWQVALPLPLQPPERQIVVGICCMMKKSKSKPMTQILERLCRFEYITVVIFPEDAILNEAVDKWPLCDCLISFHSKGKSCIHMNTDRFLMYYIWIIFNILQRSWFKSCIIQN